MANISFLGLGAMGSRMVSHLVNAGHNVTVWNRSIKAAEKFTDSNVLVADTPVKAAQGADFIFSMVRDNEASEFVWLDEVQGAINGMSESAIAIECSTVTPDHIAMLKGKFDGKQLRFVDAPVVGSRPQADAGKLVFLVGAAGVDFSSIENVISPMAGAIHHLGEVGSGSNIKLAVNAFFAMQLAGIAELLGFLQSSGIPLDKALNTIGSLPVCSPAAKISAEAMLARQFASAFPIELVAKDLEYLKQASAAVQSEVPVTAEVARLFEQAKFKGYGSDNITAIAKLFM